MISIIVCSRNLNSNAIFLENIRQTVGCDYELIIIDNSENKYSIFEAYNLGIRKSQGQFLCFIHDDIKFHTPNWGCILKSIFDLNSDIGLIGVAGSKIKTKMPSAWWDCDEDKKIINIIQHSSNKEKEFHNHGFENSENVKAVVIDGVFMAMRKNIKFEFSSKLKGFHAYDLNLSLEIYKKGFNTIVTDKILLEHFSSGVINDSWIRASYEIHKLNRNLLPIVVNGTLISKSNEVMNAQRFINKCIQLKLKKIALAVWFQLFLIHPISKYHFRFWKAIFKTI